MPIIRSLYECFKEWLHYIAQFLKLYLKSTHAIKKENIAQEVNWRYTPIDMKKKNLRSRDQRKPFDSSGCSFLSIWITGETSYLL
ncbi:hypothetical protein GN156_06200 [bacterium LRH843]|nr:hypothetical protein [bacterium LRH843]